MYSPQYCLYQPNIQSYPQLAFTDIQYISIFTHLPSTYQNYMALPGSYFQSINIDPQVHFSGQPESSSFNKENDDSQTREKCNEKKNYKKTSIFKYPKKNAESNIINQIFSFLSLRTKSESILEKILYYSQEKLQNFYQILKQLKKKNKKYINRCYIKDLAFLEQGHIGHQLIEQIRTKKSKNGITVEEFKKAIRILVSYYLKTKCISTVITSRKLDKETMKEHLHRKREVHEYFGTQMEILKNNSQE